MRATDLGIELTADASRVVARLFLPGETIGPSRSRVDVITARVAAMADHEAEAARLIADFSPRHHGLAELFVEHARAGLGTIGAALPDDPAHRTVLGASFTSEYAVEGAALCNPSVAIHLDQSGLTGAELRVVVSLRQIGEGHVSTMGFATAVIGESWRFEPRATPLVIGSVVQADATWSSYHVSFPPATALSQRVIQPVIAEERNGIEDARLTCVTAGDGSIDYRATYTAYDGQGVVPRMLVSADLTTFTSHRLSGPASSNKGMTLFPRLVQGEHLALVRSDGETNALARSRDGLDWYDETPVFGPTWPWEIVQSGNCGAPIETPEGWLVLTHGVGPMRVYSIGAVLLDLEDPVRMIGMLEQPLITSDGSKQNGYVPNVVYSCGSIIHEGMLWIPHGVGDNRIRVASIAVPELLAAMRRM